MTAWEVAIKQSIGKLELSGFAEQWLTQAVARCGIGWIDVTYQQYP